MFGWTSVEVVIARLVSLGAHRREDMDDEAGIYFSYRYRGVEWTFLIPQPLEDDGYTEDQLNIVEVELSRLGIDLLPLDQNLIQ